MNNLWKAIKSCDLSNLRKIISEDRSVLNKEINGWTPLRIASYYGHVEVVTELLKEGAEQIADIKGFTPLMLAAQKGHTDIIQVLLNSSTATIDMKLHASGQSALYFAAINGYSDAVTALLDAGADCDIKDKLGFTPIMAACQEGHHEIVKKLIEKGGANPELPDNYGYFPIHQAAQNDRAEAVKVLLENNVNVNTVSTKLVLFEFLFLT